MKPITDCTHEELQERLKARLVSDLFAGTLRSFISAAIELSITWWIAEEERRKIAAKVLAKKEARKAHPGLSRQAVNVLHREKIHDKKSLLKYLDHSSRMLNRSSLTILREIPTCGRSIAREIITYYGLD